MTTTQTHSNNPQLQVRLLSGFQMIWEGERLAQLQTPLFRRLLTSGCWTGTRRCTSNIWTACTGWPRRWRSRERTGRPLPPHPARSLAPVERAQSCLRRARTLYREAGNEQGEAIALHNLGYTHLPRFNASDDPQEQRELPGEMITYLEEAVSVFRQHERYSALAQSLNWLGHVHARWLDRASAVAYFEEALAAISRTEDPMILVDVLSTVAGRLWLPAGQLADAAALLALAEAHPAADVRVRRRSRRQLAEIEKQLSAATFAAAVARGRRLTTAEAAAEMLEMLAIST